MGTKNLRIIPDYGTISEGASHHLTLRAISFDDPLHLKSLHLIRF